MVKLEVKDVSFSYDGKTNVIENINIKLNKGEIVGLLGASGGGKTTLFNVISGLIKPQRGNIFLDGEDITGKHGKMSYMLQKDLLMEYKTIEDNIALPLIIKGEKKNAARKKVGEYFS